MGKKFAPLTNVLAFVAIAYVGFLFAWVLLVGSCAQYVSVGDEWGAPERACYSNDFARIGLKLYSPIIKALY
jgi:hypothetical protein